MASNALGGFQRRLTEIQQLVDAHGALVRLKKAEEAQLAAAGDLSRISKVIDALVSPPGPGRPPQVQALNSAAIALLSGHLQGFVTELHEEAARSLLGDAVDSVDALIDVAPKQGNPNEHNITKLFASLGFAKVLNGISWQRMGNDALKKKLREFNELRNRVAHGAGETVSKDSVANYMKVWSRLATELDRKVGREIKKRIGEAPW